MDDKKPTAAEERLAKVRAARDAHAEKHDDGETCGDVKEHQDLFGTTPNARET